MILEHSLLWLKEKCLSSSRRLNLPGVLHDQADVPCIRNEIGRVRTLVDLQIHPSWVTETHLFLSIWVLKIYWRHEHNKQNLKNASREFWN